MVKVSYISKFLANLPSDMPIVSVGKEDSELGLFSFYYVLLRRTKPQRKDEDQPETFDLDQNPESGWWIVSPIYFDNNMFYFKNIRETAGYPSPNEEEVIALAFTHHTEGFSHVDSIQKFQNMGSTFGKLYVTERKKKGIGLNISRRNKQSNAYKEIMKHKRNNSI